MSYCDINARTIFVDEITATRRQRRHMYLKHRLWSSIIGKQDLLFVSYSTSQFLALISDIKAHNGFEGVRIYFASYTSGQYVPSGHENNMALIFAPTKERPSDPTEYDDIGDYYVLDHTNPASRPASIPKTIKDAWVNNYIDNKWNVVSSRLNINETRSIWYSKNNVEAFEYEIDCWRHNGNPVEAILILYSSYLISEEWPTNPPYNLDKQLTLIFNFIQARSLSDEEEDKLMKNNQGFKKLVKFRDYDTGSPCPPAKCP